MNRIARHYLKKIRIHLQHRYKDILTFISNEKDNIKKLEELDILIDYEPYFYDEIKEIKVKLKIKKDEDVFQTKVNQKQTAQEYMLMYIQEQILLVKEAIHRMNNTNSATSDSIQTKEKKLQKLNKRLEDLQFSESRIKSLIQDLAPVKRKVGRPKKSEEIHEQQDI